MKKFINIFVRTRFVFHSRDNIHISEVLHVFNMPAIHDILGSDTLDETCNG